MPGLPTAAGVHARLLTAVGVMAAITVSLAIPAASHARRSARLDHQEARIVRLVNQIRGDYGLSPVRVSRRLNRAANAHSTHMLTRDFFSHTSSNGTPTARRVRRYREAKSVGEVLAYVPGSQRRGAARRVVSMWMGSAGHRAVLVSSSFDRIGLARQIGRLHGRRAVVFTADLTSRR